MNRLSGIAEMIQILIDHMKTYELTGAGIVFIVILIASIWLVQLIAFGFEKIFQKNVNGWIRCILVILLSFSVTLSMAYAWLNQVQPASEKVNDALISADSVIVYKTDYGWFFDSWGTENAMVFYGEEQIDETAYAPLMRACANQGLDCFLLEPQFHRHYLDDSCMPEVMNRHSYPGFFTGGIGSSAVSAVSYANAYPEVFDGVILFDAVPEETMNEDSVLIAIYAAIDGMNTGGYEEAKKSFPLHTREASIDGAVHAGFAETAVSEVSEKASISPELQRQIAGQMIRQALIHGGK